MKPWREGWPGGKIRSHYAQPEKINRKLEMGKSPFCIDKKLPFGIVDSKR
jgi:hypothetical protein